MGQRSPPLPAPPRSRGPPSCRLPRTSGRARCSSSLRCSKKGQGEEATRATAALLDRALAKIRDPRDVARLVLAKGALAGEGKLPEAELERIDPAVLRTREDRAALAGLLRAVAARRRAAGDLAGSNRAALGALRATEMTELVSAATDDAERLSLLLATGDVRAAAELAVDRWAKAPGDADALQAAASSLLRAAVKAEEDRAALDERQKAWEAAVGVSAILCSWPGFWESFARRREGAYKKEVDAEQREAAQKSAKERVVKLLREVEERHRDAGRVEDRALLGRMVDAFGSESASAQKLKRLVDQHPGAGLPDLPFPCGPLGLDVLELREQTFQAVHKLAETSTDSAVQELYGALGELAEGWSLLSDGRADDAGAFARAKLALQPRNREAIRLLSSAARKRIVECLGEKNLPAAEAVLAWFAAEVPAELSREVLLLADAHIDAADIVRARQVVQQVRARGDSEAWRAVEATVLFRSSVWVANERKDFHRAIELLVEARALDPANAKLEEGIRISATNLLLETIETNGHDAAIVQLEQLGAERVPPLAAALARGLNLRGVKRAEAKDGPGARTDLERALKLMPESEVEIRKTIRDNLAQVFMVLASAELDRLKYSTQYTRPVIREAVINYLKLAASHGSEEALKALKDLGVPGYGGYNPYAYGRR